MVTENAGSGKGSIDENVTVDELLEAKRHIYFMTPNEYRGITGRSLDDVEFVSLTSNGHSNYPQDNHTQASLHQALIDMYRQMKQQGVEFALGFTYHEAISSRYNNTILGLATGVKRKPKEGDL